ncbi:hypothetical protein DUNSADRAFT_16571 [Dunaliella salina]|uniref:Uncharacterized protein n=1 Tax=Dunaliella salina TaxID=3046 RepID=A0ABQ7H0V6_DUNSA|nr:hypothetical protein DUNSADRAFT_16571 [Dunaliella salina]|eukprot:KAF5840480.1 hypothetical protein DUNSADRAFT_16571 [Dunaliella salina]
MNFQNLHPPTSHSSSLLHPTSSTCHQRLIPPHTRLSQCQQQRQRGIVAAYSSGHNSTTSTRGNNNNQEEMKQKARVAAQGAQSKLKDMYTQAQESAARTWIRLDSEYNLNSKVERAGKRVEETWRDVDQTFKVRRRLRNSTEYVQRRWPTWQKQLDQFATTWYGKTTLLIAIVAVISSPIFWRVMNIVLLVWWLAIPVAAAVVNSVQKRAAMRAQEEAEEEARRANPFAEIFRPRQGKRSSSTQQEGPVIEADYVVISKDEKK